MTIEQMAIELLGLSLKERAILAEKLMPASKKKRRLMSMRSGPLKP
jgi:hypothetical protein